MPFLCTSKPASVVAPELTRSGARWFVDQKGSPPRDNADGKHRVLNPAAKTRPTRKHGSHREGSEKLAIYTRLKQQQNTPLAQNKVWRFLNQSRKKWDLWAKSSLIAQTTMRKPQAQQRLHAFQVVTLAMMCHRPHMAPTTSAAWEPPQQTHHALKSHESDFEAPTNNTKTGGHSKPHQSAAGARHVCDDADLSSATCNASDGRRSKIVHTSRGSTGAALSWRKNLWPISPAYTTILLKLSMVRPPVLA